MKFNLTSANTVKQVLKREKLLRIKEGYRTIYLCPDRTVEERRALEKLKEELKLKRKLEPSKFHVIRNRRIIMSSDRKFMSASISTDNISIVSHVSPHTLFI